MLALTKEISSDAGDKGFKFLTNNRIETLVNVVLQQIPDRIISKAMDMDESHFYNVFDAMGVKLPDGKGKSKLQATTLLSTAKDDFNRSVSHIIGSIAEQREVFLTKCKEGELVVAEKRADRATSREILLNDADRSAASPEVSCERCTSLRYHADLSYPCAFWMYRERSAARPNSPRLTQTRMSRRMVPSMGTSLMKSTDGAAMRTSEGTERPPCLPMPLS